jgi:gliding motility-associated-like protein
MCTHEYVDQIQITIPIADFDYLPLINGSVDSVVCVPRRVRIDNQSQDWKNYQLNWGDGYIGYGRADHVLFSDTVYDLTLSITDKHGCKDTLVRNNMYRSNDVVTNFDVTNILGCNTLTIDFQDLSSVTSDVVWDFGDGTISNQNNPQHQYNSEGFYDVTLYSISVEGCKDTLRKVEYVKFIYPEINFSISDNEICKNEVISFLDSSKGLFLSYNWDFGNGVISTDKSPTHTFSNVGVFPLTLSITDTFGCVSVHNTEVITVQEVVADFSSSSSSSSNCPPLITSFNNNSTGNIINYNWIFGDGISSNQQSPSHLYSYSGNFNVGLIIEDDFSCSDTLIFENLISVFGPTGNFTFSDSLICNSDSVSFLANTENVDSYLWDFGDGIFSVDSNPVHLYSSGNFYHPILIISNSSSSCQLIVSSEDSIEVRQVILDVGLDRSLCLGDSIVLNIVTNVSSFNWDNSLYISNTNAQNPLVFPITSSMFYVTSTDGMCFSSDSVFVDVYDNIPQPTFTNLKNCYLDSMEFFASSGIVASSFDWEWKILGENLSSQNSFFKFDTLGIYSVELMVTNLDNNCTATFINNVEVLPIPLVDFTSEEVCIGEKTSFINLSASDINTSLWSFGNDFQSSFQSNPSNVFSEVGVFNTTLVVSSDNGCLNSITKEVVVHEIPEIEMSVSTQCEGEESQLFATLNSSDSVIWEWSFSDNSFLDSKQFTTHLFPYFGVYDISLKATSIYSCVANLSATATINPNPKVDFEVIRICEGENTQFINESTVELGSIFSYEWSFLGSTVSNDKNPSHIFGNPGIHSVLLNVTSSDNCSANLERDIVIHSLPQVNFLADREVCEDEELSFVNNSLVDGLITSVKWEFGDNSFSEEENPNHSYRNPNFYTISLEIETEFGCSSFIEKENFIQVIESPLARFSMSDNKVSLLSSEIIFTNLSDENLYFEWDFDNGIINSEDRVVSNSFSETGLFEVLLYVENEFGCRDELIHEVVVEEVFSVFVPTAFTPNNDGLNDVFEVKVNGVYSFEMKIYNRWGEMVYFSDNIDYGWDGKESLSNDVIENGTYLYHIYVTDNNEKPWVYNGELNLMK